MARLERRLRFAQHRELPFSLLHTRYVTPKQFHRQTPSIIPDWPWFAIEPSFELLLNMRPVVVLPTAARPSPPRGEEKPSLRVARAPTREPK